MEKQLHKLFSDKTVKIVENSPYELVCKLGEILENRKISQARLSELTGIRPATISDMVQNKKKAYNFDHLLCIMTVLGIVELSELIAFQPKSK